MGLYRSHVILNRNHISNDTTQRYTCQALELLAHKEYRIEVVKKRLTFLQSSWMT